MDSLFNLLHLQSLVLIIIVIIVIIIVLIFQGKDLRVALDVGRYLRQERRRSPGEGESIETRRLFRSHQRLSLLLVAFPDTVIWVTRGSRARGAPQELGAGVVRGVGLAVHVVDGAALELVGGEVSRSVAAATAFAAPLEQHH
jgi:preprotein translocase subunit SecY